MQGYSPQEFERMQKQAIDRVHEMQRQAKMGAAENRRGAALQGAQLHYANSAAQQKSAPPPKESRPPQDEKNSAHPKAMPPANEKKAPDFPFEPPKVKRVPSRSKAAPFLSMDSDTALILPLILLLQKDGADEMLILALLYIMA